MTVTLGMKVEQWITEQVRAGRFPSAEAAVEAMVTEWIGGQRTGEPLDADDLAAIAEADAEFTRGEGIALADLRSDYARRYGLDL